MSVKKYIKYLNLLTFIGMCLPLNAHAYSYNLSAISVLRQAQIGNMEYFELLKRYPRAIDIMDNSGDTAYCMAFKIQDMETASFLAQQGANVRHSCIRRLQHQVRQKKLAKQSAVASRNQNYEQRFKNDSFFASDSNIWYTVGGIAVVGGVAAAIAGISIGGSHHSDSGDDPTPEPVGDLTDMTADEFRTDEYNRSNFLAGIHAAEAYAHIYKKDSVGNIFSHQANSDSPLEKIKVGVLDTGVYNNNDLNNKIKRTYDINQYSGASSMWSYISSPTKENYVFKVGGYYYGATFNLSTMQGDIWKNESGSIKLTESEMKKLVGEKISGVTFSDMTLMNGESGQPGVDMSTFITSTSDTTKLLNNWFGLAHNMSHGTHVTGIIAAKKNDSGMHGVAFENAQIYAASWDLSSATSIYGTVKNMVDEGVVVLNNSWGYGANATYNADTFPSYMSSLTDEINSYVYLANHKGVWVHATGNEGYSNADIYTGIGKVDLSSYGYSGPGEYEVPFIAVASLDVSTATASAPSGKLASYSNKCGSTKDYCIAASGTNILSTAASNQGFIYMDGTSMATPTVTGSIALLNGYYPWLSAQNVAYLLLETANNTGTYADSATYGRGALDLEAAITKPVGGLGIATSDNVNSLQSIGQSKLHLTGATQKQLAKAMPKDMVAFDVLKRPFKYDMANMVSKTHGSNANLRNEVSHMAMTGAKKVIKDEKTGFSFSSSEAMNKNGQANLSSMEIVKETGDGESTRFYYAEQSKYATSEDALKPSTNPYLSMRQAYGAENTMKLSESSKLKLSLQTGENGLYERDYEQDRQSFKERSYAINAEYNFNLTDYLELATVGGMLFEEDAMLGMNGEGGFAIRDGSTYYMGIKAALNITPNLSLLMAYYRGYTQGQDTSLMSISDLETESYMMAAEYRLNGRGDKVGLSLSSPLSVVKGKAGFKYASGRDNYSDTVYMQKLTTSLKPAAQEYDLGLYYMGKPKEDFGIMGKVETRFNADGEKGLNDYIGIIGASKSF